MPFPPDHVLTSGKLGIFIIDVEEYFLGQVKHTPEYLKLVAANRQLIQFGLDHPLRTITYLISYTDEVSVRASFPELEPRFKKASPASLRFYSKNHDSSFDGTRLMADCANADVGVVIAGGINSSACYAKTFVSGLRQEFVMLMPNDAHMDVDPRFSPHRINLRTSEFMQDHLAELFGRICRRMPAERLYANVGTTAEALAYIKSVWKKSQPALVA